MENAMILLYDLCRLCLDEPGEDNIFGPVDWSQDIFTYTGVKVTSTDEFPQTICNSCRDIIRCTKLLRDVATTNDARLQALRGSQGSEQVPTLSSAKVVTITACPSSDIDQNESGETPDKSNCSIDISYKNRIIFEDDKSNSSHSKKEKHRKKRISSSKRESENSAPKKMLSVRTDLFSRSEAMTSSSPLTKNSNKINKVEDKAGSRKITVTSSTKIKSCSSSNNDGMEAGSCKVVTSSTKSRSSTPTSHDSMKAGCSKIVTSSTKINASASSSNEDRKSIKPECDFVCETCNKTYATHKKLYLHQLIHNKKFICPLDGCEKKFAIKNDLQKHIRSHTGEKPFKCNLCEQSFSQNVSLKSHKETVHSEKQSQG